MKIETYMDEEMAAVGDIPGQSEEWQAQIKKLGLTGQESLLTEGVEGAKPFPFSVMGLEQIAVYMTVCSDRCEMKEFKKEAIPLRVLAVLALCLEQQYFDRIEIWAEPSGFDPIAVGIKKVGYREEISMLARWGKELVSFGEMKKLAIDTIEKKLKPRCQNLRNEIEQGFLDKYQMHWTTRAFQV